MSLTCFLCAVLRNRNTYFIIFSFFCFFSMNKFLSSLRSRFAFQTEKYDGFFCSLLAGCLFFRLSVSLLLPMFLCGSFLSQFSHFLRYLKNLDCAVLISLGDNKLSTPKSSFILELLISHSLTETLGIP